jgi:hypothetical protein
MRLHYGFIEMKKALTLILFLIGTIAHAGLQIYVPVYQYATNKATPQFALNLGSVQGVDYGSDTQEKLYLTNAVPAGQTLAIGMWVYENASDITSVTDTKGNSYSMQVSQGAGPGLVIYSSILTTPLTAIDSVSFNITTASGGVTYWAIGGVAFSGSSSSDTSATGSDAYGTSLSVFANVAPNSVQFGMAACETISPSFSSAFSESSMQATPEGPVYFLYNGPTSGALNMNGLWGVDVDSFGAFASFK